MYNITVSLIIGATDLYNLERVVWEITSVCNMKCIHCGSDCNCIKIGQELTTQECLEIIEDLSDLECNHIIFAGGEPLFRKDLGILCSACKQQGINTAIISNGYLVNDDNIKLIKAFDLLAFGMSIDAAEPYLQDYIRGKAGSFAHVKKAIELLNQNDIPISVVTTVHKLNYEQLPKIRDFLIENDIHLWQIQYGDNIGRLNKNWKITEAQFLDIAKFIIETNKKYSKEQLFTSGSDVFGYISNTAKKIQGIWQGCHAGTRIAGISANGDIRGCLSLQEDKYIEGNVRNRSFKDIWLDKNSFKYNRRFSCEMLTDYCRDCYFSSVCKGGCYRAATINGGRCVPYCLYHIEKDGFSSKEEAKLFFSKKELFDLYNPVCEMPKEYLK